MLQFTAAADITVKVAFTDDGEPFVPDSAGLAWYLRDQAGAAGSPTTLTGVVDSFVDITVLAAANAIPGGKRFGKRFVCVTGTSNSQPFTIVVPYTLVPWINSIITADDVRSYLGVNPGELPDSAIDLVEAYFEVVDSVGDEPTVTAALASGTAIEKAANDAILMKAVMGVIPRLQLSLSQAESDGSLSVERLAKLDLASLYMLATLTYADAITAITLRVKVNPARFVVTVPTDPVTGH
jgi:hypothetical protein